MSGVSNSASSQSQFVLLKQKKFAPLFVTQMLAAFNDNVFKTTIAVLIAYSLWDIGNWQADMLISITAGMLVLPFLLFAPFAGALADKYDKDVIIKWLKVAELLIVLLAWVGIILQSVWFMLFVLFLLGMQSALFSPNKFSILPQHLNADELIGGNALVNTGTYVAILLGTILGSALGATHQGIMIILSGMTTCALLGLYSSFYIPHAQAPQPDLKLRLNMFLQTWENMRLVYNQHPAVFAAMIGSAWFFFIGALYIAQMPTFVSLVLHADQMVLTFFMGLFLFGVALGGLVNNALLQGQISARYVMPAAVMIGLFSFDLYWAGAYYQTHISAAEGAETPLSAFIQSWAAWRIIADLFFIALAGGIYIVPLKAVVQEKTQLGHMARVVACGGMLDALFVLVSALLAIIVYTLGLSVLELFLAVSVLSPLFIWYLKLKCRQV